jgi:hypothetical protein
VTTLAWSPRAIVGEDDGSRSFADRGSRDRRSIAFDRDRPRPTAIIARSSTTTSPAASTSVGRAWSRDVCVIDERLSKQSLIRLLPRTRSARAGVRGSCGAAPHATKSLDRRVTRVARCAVDYAWTPMETCVRWTSGDVASVAPVRSLAGCPRARWRRDGRHGMLRAPFERSHAARLPGAKTCDRPRTRSTIFSQRSPGHDGFGSKSGFHRRGCRPAPSRAVTRIRKEGAQV